MAHEDSKQHVDQLLSLIDDNDIEEDLIIAAFDPIVIAN